MTTDDIILHIFYLMATSLLRYHGILSQNCIRVVNPMLAIRNILCSARWKEDWPKIEARLRQHTRQRRRTVHLAHHPPPPTSLIARALRGGFGDTIPEPPKQQLTPFKPRKNPWRNFKHGKALYQRSTPPEI